MVIKEMSYRIPSKDGKTMLLVKEYIPEKPVAVLLMELGTTEHLGAVHNVEMAKFFAEKNYIVVVYDRVGHGMSVPEDGTGKMDFGPGGWKTVVADTIQVSEMAIAKYSNLPCFIEGFSLGSFSTMSALIDRPDLNYAGVILAGTGYQNAVEIMLGWFMAMNEVKKYGRGAFTKNTDEYTYESYNKFFDGRTKADWLTSNESALDEFLADPLVGEGFTAGAFEALLCGMKKAAKMRNLKRIKKEIPFLFLSGSGDPVGNFTKGVTKASKRLENAGVKDVTLRIYKGMRHAIFMEEGKRQVFNEMNTWMRNYFFDN